MAPSAIQRIKGQQARGIVFAPNILPDEINQLLVDLCELVVRQDLQIQGLSLAIRTQRMQLSSCQCGVRALAGQQPSLNVLRSEIATTWGKISGLEDCQAQLRFTFLQSTKSTDESLAHLASKLSETESDLRSATPPLRPRRATATTRW
jgi:hypothetical protein